MYLFTSVIVSLKKKTNPGVACTGERGREERPASFAGSTQVSHSLWHWMQILCLGKITNHFISQLFVLRGNCENAKCQKEF